MFLLQNFRSFSYKISIKTLSLFLLCIFCISGGMYPKTKLLIPDKDLVKTGELLENVKQATVPLL